MRMTELRAAGTAVLALWLATPVVWAQAGNGRFDGTWNVEFSGNQFCYAPHEAGHWTIRNGVIATARGQGTLDRNGRAHMRFPGAYFGHTNLVSVKLTGNQGTGTSEVEGTQCRETISLKRVGG